MYTAPRIVVAGVGVNHEELVEWSTEYLGSLSSSNEVGKPEQAEYLGGEERVKNESLPLTHVFVGFKAPGWNDNGMKFYNGG